MISPKSFLTDPLFLNSFLIAIVTGCFLVIIISTAKKHPCSDRDHLMINFVVALFFTVISGGLTWFSAKIASQNEQAKLANSAMRHLELIRRFADRLSTSIEQITANPSSYSSSEDTAVMRRQISGFNLQVQALKDGVDTAIGDWENILSHDVLKQLPQHSRFSDLEGKVGVIDKELQTLKTESKK